MAFDKWNADPRSSYSRSYEQQVLGESASAWDIRGSLKRRTRRILDAAMVAMALATVVIFALLKT